MLGPTRIATANQPLWLGVARLPTASLRASDVDVDGRVKPGHDG